MSICEELAVLEGKPKKTSSRQRLLIEEVLIRVLELSFADGHFKKGFILKIKAKHKIKKRITNKKSQDFLEGFLLNKNIRKI